MFFTTIKKKIKAQENTEKLSAELEPPEFLWPPARFWISGSVPSWNVDLLYWPNPTTL